MKNILCENLKEEYVQPVSKVYELSLESTILQSSIGGSTTDLDDDGEGSMTLSDFRSRNF